MKLTGRASMYAFAILCALSATASVALAENTLVSAILTGTSTLAGLVTIRLIVVRTVRTGVTQLLRRSETTEKRLSTLAWRVEKTPAIAGTSHRIRNQLQEIADSLKSFTDSTNNNARPDTPRQDTDSPSRPPSIEAMMPGVGPRTAGRLAGAAPQGGAFNQIAEKMHRDSLAPLSIAAVLQASPPPDNQTFKWHPIDPFICIAQLERAKPELLVIDAAALTSGKWARATQAAGTRLYTSLWELLLQAKRNRIPIVLTGSTGPASTFTEELNSFVDIHVEDGVYSIGHEARSNIHLINDLVAALESTTTTGGAQ